MKRARQLVAALILALLLPALVAPAYAAQDAASPDMAAIDRYVETQLRTLGVPGAALGIVHGNQIVHLRGFGQADSAGRPMTPQTPQLLGSLTKSFTAVAIMQLVEQGKVELDTPIQHYIPWFRVADPEASAQITVRHLLTHTSGISGRGDAAQLLRDDRAPEALQRQVRALATVELTQPVGSAWQYANANYAVLGLIVEQVSGLPYEAYMQRAILTPLQMGDSFPSPELAPPGTMAAGHQYWFGRPRATQLPYPRGLLPAGYLVSSAEDMSRYLLAHLNGGSLGGARILSAESVAELHRPGVAIDEGLWTAMGWGVGDLDGVRVLQHDGDTANYRAEMWLLPERGWGFVLLLNASNALQTTPSRMLGQGILALLVGDEPQPVALNPLAHTFYATVMLLAALELLGVAQSARALRRWATSPPSGGRWRRIILPFLGNLLVALLFLGAIPALFLGGSLATAMLLAPDLALTFAVAGSVALGWGLLRTALAVRLLRRPPVTTQRGMAAATRQ